MNKTEILKKYQADNVKVAPEFMSWMRSNHAGETGAVWIYKGASYVFWSKKIRLMAEEHGQTEQHHLTIMEYLVPYNKRSIFIPLWRLMGFALGFVPAIFGYKGFCLTIDAVETFVEAHYNEQIDYLIKTGSNPKLLNVIKRCCDEEIEHQQDAHQRRNQNKTGIIARTWFKIVELGSMSAVSIAKKL